MAESSRGQSSQDDTEPEDKVVVDVAEAMRDHAKRLGFDFDPDSDSDSDLVSPVSDFTDEDYKTAREECRKLDLQGDPADFYIERIAVPLKSLATREKRVAQRERRISRHHPKVEAKDWYKYQDDYLKRTSGGPDLESASIREENLDHVPKHLAVRRTAILKAERRLDRREWEAGKYEYIVFNSKKDPIDFLRKHDKLLTTKGKLEEKLSKASDLREEALAAVKELPVIQGQLEKAHAEMKSLDDMVAYENRRATDLEKQIHELQQKDKEMRQKIGQYRDRNAELQDTLRNEKYELEQEINYLESKLYPLQEEMPQKEQRIEALECQAKKDIERIKELTEYGDKTTKSLEETKKAEAESREKADFYRGIYGASNEAANFHAKEAEDAVAKEKEARDEAKLVDERYKTAKNRIGELDGQLAEALQKFKDADEEVKQVKAELHRKEQDLALVNHELQLVYHEDRRVSVSTNVSGPARVATNLQDELDEAGWDQFSEPAQSPMLSPVRARLNELEEDIKLKTTEVADYKTKLEAKEAEVEKAYKELKEKATQINNLAQSVKELTADNDQLRASAEKGRKDHAAKSSEDEDKYAKLYYTYDSLKKDCFESCQKISALTDRMQDKVALIKKQLADSHCTLLEAAQERDEKTEEIARLTNHINMTRATSRQQYESLSRNFHLLHGHFKQMNRLSQARISEIAQLQEELAARPDPDQVARLQRAHDDIEELYENMKTSLDDSTNDNVLLRADRDRLEARVNALNRDVAGLTDERDQLANDLHDSTQQVASLRGERDQLAKDLEASAKSLGRVQDIRDKMAEDLEGKINEINSVKDARDQTEKDLKASAKENESLKDARNKQSNELAGLAEETDNLTHERDRVTKELQDLRAANARHELWRADNGNAPRKLLEQGKELGETERKLTEALMNSTARNVEIQELRAEIDQRKADIQALEEQSESDKKQVAKLDSSSVDLESQLKAANHEAAKTSFKMTELKERIAELEEQLDAIKDTAKGEKSRAEDDFAKSKSRVAELEARIAELEDKLQIPEQERSRLEDELTKSNDRAAELETKTAGLEEQLKQQDERIRDHRAKVDEATEIATKATNERLDAVNSLQDTNRKLQVARRQLFLHEERVASLKCDIYMAEGKHAKEMAEKQAENQAEIDELNGKIAEMRDEIARLEESQMDPDDLARFVDTMEGGFDDLEQAKEQAEEAIVARDEQIRDLESELETTKQIATDMGLQLYDMENEIKDLQGSRNKSDAANAEKLDPMTNIRTRLQQLLKKASDCQAAVEQKVANLDALLKESRDSATRAEQRLDALKDELKECGAKLLAEEAKTARQAVEITELEEGRAKDCEASLAKVKQLEAELRELRDEITTRTAKEKELEDLVKYREEEVKALEADKQQRDEQSQRILELQKSLANITDQQTQNGQASVVAAQELQTKLDETNAINDRLVKDLMALTDKAATWDVKEKDFMDLVQLQVETVKALQDQLKQTTLQYRAIVRRSMGDAAIIQTLRADTSKVWSDLVDATRENARLRQQLKDLQGQERAEPPKAESLCYTCGRGCKCPIALPEASGFFDQWWLVLMAIWAFLEMMPKNTRIAFSYLLGLLGLPGRCWRPFASRAKFWYRKLSSPKGKTRAAGAPGDPDWDWPTVPAVPHAAMVYTIIFWAVVLAIFISSMSFWATSVERHLWLRANTDTRAYFNFGRREGAPGACLVPQPLPVDYRFVYEPTYGNFCEFVERQTGYALC